MLQYESLKRLFTSSYFCKQFCTGHKEKLSQLPGNKTWTWFKHNIPNSEWKKKWPIQRNKKSFTEKKPWGKRRKKKGSIFQITFNSTSYSYLWCILPCLAKNNVSEQRTAVRLPGQHELWNKSLSDWKLTIMVIKIKVAFQNLVTDLKKMCRYGLVKFLKCFASKVALSLQTTCW